MIKCSKYTKTHLHNIKREYSTEIMELNNLNPRNMTDRIVESITQTEDHEEDDGLYEEYGNEDVYEEYNFEGDYEQYS